MLILVVVAGRIRVAVRAQAVIEVIPRVVLSPTPGAPPAFVGLLDYHGKPVPVLDLASTLSETRPAASFANRILILSRPATMVDVPLAIGIAVDAVAEVKRIADSEVVQAPRADETAVLSGLLRDEAAFLPMLFIERLFTDAARMRNAA